MRTEHNAYHTPRWLMQVISLGLLALLVLANASPSFAQSLYPWTQSGPGSLQVRSDIPRLGSEIVVSTLDNEQLLPTVAYNWKHREFLVVWHDKWAVGTRDIRGRRVAVDGTVLAEFEIYSNPTRDSAQPSVSYDPVNDRYLVVWVYDAAGDGSDWDLYGRFIPWEGPNPAVAEFAIITWSSKQWNPKVAYARTQGEFLVVWWNEDPAHLVDSYVSGKRIYADGSGFPSTGSDVTISVSGRERVDPDVAYNLRRNEYLVVYTDGVDIFGERLRGDAAPLGSEEFGIAGWPDAERRPSVAACKEADQYLVAWQSLQGGADEAVYARFINGEGAPGTVFQVDNTTSPEEEPDVACDLAGQRYMVTWQSRYTNVKYGVLGRLVDPGGALTPAIELRQPGSAADRTRPAIAGGDTSFLVVWEHDRDSTAYQDIHGRLITPHAVFMPVVRRP